MDCPTHRRVQVPPGWSAEPRRGCCPISRRGAAWHTLTSAGHRRGVTARRDGSRDHGVGKRYPRMPNEGTGSRHQPPCGGVEGERAGVAQQQSGGIVSHRVRVQVPLPALGAIYGEKALEFAEYHGVEVEPWMLSGVWGAWVGCAMCDELGPDSPRWGKEDCHGYYNGCGCTECTGRDLLEQKNENQSVA